MERCIDVLAEVDRIFDAEVSRMARLRFALHLAMCPACERYYRQYAAVRQAVGKVEPADLPEDFDQVMGGIVERVLSG